MVTRYGIISDTHQKPLLVDLALDVLKKLGADRLILNGDLGTGQQHITYTLDAVGRSGLEAYVQPGSHEKLGDFEPVIKHFSGVHSNLINTMDNPKVDVNGHHLVFLPGSDWVAGGEYLIKDIQDNASGFYKVGEDVVRLSNMNDLRRLVTVPDKTVVACHVPRKFFDVDNCVDMAYFGEFPDKSVSPGVIIENQIRSQIGKDTPYPQVVEVAEQNGISLRRENRGNSDLASLYYDLGITKSVTGHFHESVHRANDTIGRHVPEGKLVDELFWNASYLDEGKVGILTVDDGRVSYQNIDLHDYVGS